MNLWVPQQLAHVTTPQPRQHLKPPPVCRSAGTGRNGREKDGAAARRRSGRWLARTPHAIQTGEAKVDGVVEVDFPMLALCREQVPGVDTHAKVAKLG